MLSDILDMADQLHTASIEFTVMREESVPIGYIVTIQCLLAEQKETSNLKSPNSNVEKPYTHD